MSETTTTTINGEVAHADGSQSRGSGGTSGAGPGDRAVPLWADPGGGRPRGVDPGPGAAGGGGGPRGARGRLVRAVAAAEHTDPTGRQVRVSRDTLDRWIRAWRRGGFDALVPSPRQSSPRLPVEVFEMAVALKRENPDRTGAQVRRILAAQMGWAPGERTLQRWFADDPQIADQL